MNHVSILNEDPLISLCWMFRTFTLYLHSCLLFVLWILIPGANTPFLSFKSMYSPLLSGGEAYKEKPADRVTSSFSSLRWLAFFLLECLQECFFSKSNNKTSSQLRNDHCTTFKFFFFLEHNEPLKGDTFSLFQKSFLLLFIQIHFLATFFSLGWALLHYWHQLSLCRTTLMMI